ncbi:MAG: class I tRNA ligase family protein, partial [Parcubacteria group bacterium]|nr:class I tRNA ligase family protein [Parcubacteria group bacterium]
MAKRETDGSSFRLPTIEKEVLRFWKEKRIFERSLQKRSRGKRFVFYEGPPSANAPPGVHHVLGRVYKDIICRYKTMQGYSVPRRAGWDTHGLPIEIAVEKAIGANSKKDIEEYGIERFNAKAKELVWKYKKEWDGLTERIGFWLDLEHPYITYETSYIESLWWIIKAVWRSRRLYRDYKVVPYCPRCGTALSSHEVAQGYERVTEDSIIVRFPMRGQERTYFLVWTTTPWTLPANVAIAVNPELTYVKVRLDDGAVGIVAEDLKERVIPQGKILGKISGKLLVGAEYEPLYRFIEPQKPAFRVVPAQFVRAEEGTGIVHIAPAFGTDDMDISRIFDLPILLTVAEDGTMKKEITPWAGLFVKEADPRIVEDLQKRTLLHTVTPFQHDYPFCWRCSTPLIYYAKMAWFIRMHDLRDTLRAENTKIHWEPSHLQTGRFGEWLSEVKDWTFSRDRYWGTPLPIWTCTQCGKEICIGSLADFERFRPQPRNTYFLFRHGESIKNQRSIASSYPEKHRYPLTEHGKHQVRLIIPTLRKAGIDLVFSSDILRARETAAMIGSALGVPVAFDTRLREIDHGALNGEPLEVTHAFFSSEIEKFAKRFPGGENWRQVRTRMVNCMQWLEKKYSGKRILVVSHGDPLWMLTGALRGLAEREVIDPKKNAYPKVGGLLGGMTVPYAPFDVRGEINLHRPYIDRLPLVCDRANCGGNLRRMPEVVDVWFDSGAMPFAQWHYPFEKEARRAIDAGEFFPADYICEGIDQTRGWFYTLLAVSVLLGKGNPYRNVISFGHVLDSKGDAMHKSKGNVVFPDEVIRKFGIDAVRWFYFTVSAAGELKRFDEREIRERERRFLATLWNIGLFIRAYVRTRPVRGARPTLLDRWISARINETTGVMTASLDRYDVPSAARALDALVDDFSNWYLRRSRRALQRPGTRKEYNRAAWHLCEAYMRVLRLCAPFTPFLAEALYRQLPVQKETSVHLADFPKPVRRRDHAVLRTMEEVRMIVRNGLAIRKRKGIRVRQPLRDVVVVGATATLAQYREIIAEELNTHSVTRSLRAPRGNAYAHEREGDVTVYLNTAIDAALAREGEIREIMRQIQDARKR